MGAMEWGRGASKVEGGIIVLLFGFQEMIGMKIGVIERIVSFIPECTAYLVHRLSQGEDGKVPYERML
jgi:hypothetical protein